MSNTFELEQNGILTEGLPTEDDKLVLHNGSNKSVSIELVANGRGLRPMPKNGRVLDAAPGVEKHRPALRYRGRWMGALLLVDARNLSFRNGIHYGNIANAWPGVETIKPAFVQVGRRHQREQMQLIIFRDGDVAYACDLHKHYLRLTCRGDQLLVDAGDVRGFGRLLVQRAELRAHGHRSLLWTLKALEEIGQEDLWSPELARRMAALE